MFNAIEDIIDEKEPFTETFRNAAKALTDAYVNEVHEAIVLTGLTPSFDQLMDKVRALHKELSRCSELVREDYREDKGHRSTAFTKICKRIVDHSTHDFLGSVKQMLSRRNEGINTPTEHVSE